MIYYFPNRPTLIPPDKSYLDNLESTGKYIAEKKWNGDNILIDTDTMQVWNRKKERHRFVPSPAMQAELDQWPKGMVINAELMQYRTKEIKDIIIVHCIMVNKGKPLIGKTWGDSRKLLEKMPAGKHVQISPVYKSGFWDLFQTADGVVIEGIILKQPAGKLVFSATPINDVSWMYKIRKPSKKYQF